MKFDRKIFHSKIAHRIFFLFVSCALFPILCLSIVSFIRVTKQLNDQSYRLLKQSVTGYAYSTLERLISLDTELQLIASSIKMSLNDPSQTHPVAFDKRSGHHFKAVAFFESENRYIPIYKAINKHKRLGKDEIRHIINSGKTAIFLEGRAELYPQIMMVRLMDLKDLSAGYIIGVINPGYLWGIDQGNSLPPDTEVCILDESKRTVFSSFSHEASSLKKDDFQVNNNVSGQFEFFHNNENYLASYRKLFLDRHFLNKCWTVVISQSKSTVLAPMLHFKTVFTPVVLLSLWVVMFLSIYVIRKSLLPLELLKQGTRRIAVQDFETQVNLTSGDEFEELAMDFNKMSAELNKQFKTMDTRAEIDRAILSSLDTGVIVNTIMHGIYDWFACDSIAISLMDSDQENTAKVYYNLYNQGKELSENSVEFSSYELESFNVHPEFLIIDADKNRPSFLSTFIEQGNKLFLILPIFIKLKLKAVIIIGRFQTKAFNIEEILQSRQMADQVAVALSNATLIEEMEQLNWGTIKALARTVDAKSSWTAGHSTRVTRMALKIGSVFGFSPNDLDILQRAALLHDIGKLGVPVAVLDKPGALDDEEYNMIKKHPSIGARILEPIPSYKNIVPIVLQHHERYDGKGYPDGLSGNEIDIMARILAVADVFDALKSDRPYREGWAVERVIDLISEEAGRQFDPDVVEVFLEIMSQEKTKAA
jgi:putative nucleotidyltransferase with HDIG domain